MAPGDTYQYNVSFTPANPVEGKEVTWESSDPDVVSIDENGYATALKIGTATITATSSRRTATCFIRVTEVAVGHVKSATLLIGGQSEADGSLKIKKEDIWHQFRPIQNKLLMTYHIKLSRMTLRVILLELLEVVICYPKYIGRMAYHIQILRQK